MNIVSPHARAVAYSVMLIATVAAVSSRVLADPQSQDDDAVRSRRDSYSVRNLVSDGFVTAEHTDSDLVNPWGIVFAPNAPVWVADNGTGLSTLYDGFGV